MKRCSDCGHTDVRPDDGRHDSLTCKNHLLEERATLKQGGRTLKAEWWELWWVKPGKRPEFIKMYGMPTPHWIPDGCFPTRALALEEKRARDNRYVRMYRIRRYTKVKS